MLSFSDAERAACKPLITLGLCEDLGREGDITSQAFLADELQGKALFVARQPGVLAGLPAAALVFETLDPTVKFTPLVSDGAALAPGTAVAEVAGRVRSLLAAERTALNFLTYLSGIASLTRRYVEAVAGTRAEVFDTRKTLPGWRVLAKYAVRAGGGRNHRMGLFDAVLIKDNHLAAWQAADPSRPFAERKATLTHTVAAAVRAARQHAPPGTVIEVEVDSLDQLRDALAAPPDIVLLDNMTPAQLQQAVALRNELAPGVELEASGGVRLETVAAIAAAGVERISVGALTHSVPALDLGLDWEASEI